jgi:cytochrome c oxidase subunit 2
VLVAGVAALTLSGCSGAAARGFLPVGITTETPRVQSLWNGAWIAALSVGVIVWGLTIWCVVAYRRRKDDDAMPVQLRYNLPIEILYTVVPLFMVGVLFFYTARDESALLKVSAHPDNIVNVAGKRWAWDFNYLSDGAYESSVQTQLTGQYSDMNNLPTLYLPVNQSTQFVLTSRDVIHSFWVPAFLMKMDMIPGRVNTFQVTPTTEGTFQGKCAELCGAYHSQMLFQVKVVSAAEYQQHISDLKGRGQTGQLPNSLNRSQLAPGEAQKIPTVGSTK